MARRKDSRIVKIRTEENDLDNQLREAGLFEDGMDFDTKKAMLAMLEESRKSAQEEENQRQQWKEQEEEILKETLNRSFRNNIEESHQGEIISGEEHESDENSRDSDVVALPLEDVADTHCLSDSGSFTLELDPLRTGSPEQVVPSTSPSFTCSLSSSQPGAACNQPSKDKTRWSHSQPHNSEDLFCDSQSLDNSKGSNRSSRRSFPPIDKVKDNKIHEKEKNKDVVVVSSQVTVDVEEQASSSITSSDKKNGGFLPNKHQSIEPKRPLRRSSSVEIVPSPSAKYEDSIKVQHSQSLSSSDSRNSVGEEFEDEDGVQLLTPVIRQRKILESIKLSNSTSEKMTSVQDAKVSNSFEVEAVQQTMEATIVGDDDDDDDDFILPTPNACQSSDAKFEQLRLHSSLPRNSVSIESQNMLQDHKRSEKESSVRDDNVVLPRVPQRPNSSLTNNISKLDNEEKINIFTNLEPSDSEENHSFNIKNDRKRNVNVFLCNDTPTIPLKRRRLGKTEKPSKAYFKNTKESPLDCASRILNMIDDMMKRIVEHQAKTMLYKLKWSAPLTVDKRLRNGIERSKVQTRRHMAELDMDYEYIPVQRTFRNSHKVADSYEVESHASEDSLPDVNLDDRGWIDVKEKRRGRKRGLHLGLNRCQRKFPALQKGKENVLSNNQDEEKNILYESDDTDDFELFPSKSSLQKKSLCGQIEAERSSPHKQDTHMDCTEVSSSKMCDVAVEKNDRAASETETIQVDSQMSDEEGLTDLEKGDSPYKKRQKVESSKLSEEIIEKRPCKRPLRKSFLLVSDNKNKEHKSFDVAEPSTSTVQDISTSRQSDPTTTVQSTNEELLLHNMNHLSKAGANAENCVNPAAKMDTSGKKSNAQSFVSSSVREVDSELKVRPSSSVDICIVEDSINLPSTSGISTARFFNKESGRDKVIQHHIRPGPLRLKKNFARKKGKTQSSENQSTTNNEAEQITSSVGTSSKGLSDTGLPIDKKDDSDEEMVPCPLCQNFFPVQKIEVHASDCSDLVDNPETPQPKEVNKKGKRKRLQNKQPAPDINIEQESEETKTSDMTTSGEARSSAGHEKCTFCKKLFKEGDDFLNHVNSCKSMEAIQHNIVSPTTSKSPGFKSVRPKVGADSPIRVVGGSTPVVKTGSLFDRLEESEEEFEIPTSPAQNCIPISQQTDSTIDYHNQFRDKTHKPMTVGANWRGARQRRQRKRKGRSTKGKAAKMKIEIKKEVQK